MGRKMDQRVSGGAPCAHVIYDDRDSGVARLGQWGRVCGEREQGERDQPRTDAQELAVRESCCKKSGQHFLRAVSIDHQTLEQIHGLSELEIPVDGFFLVGIRFIG